MTLISAITLLFLIMDPFGNMVVFSSILQPNNTKRKIIILLRESAIAYFIMMIFLFFGQSILGHLQVEAPALSIGGGIILFLIALGMVFPNLSLAGTNNGIEDSDEPFIVPLAVPFMAGPSLIAALLLLVSHEPERMKDWFIAVSIAALLSTIVLVISPFILKILRRKGTKAVERLMGLILIIISVQMFLNGIKLYLTSI